MKVEKKQIAKLNKCYSLAELNFHGEHCFLTAAEKQDPCYLFREDGEKIDTVWEGPGGVMTMAQVPGSDGQFLATQKFYSPNDSKEAKIVIATPLTDGTWQIRTLCDAPFVHRFGILNRNGVNYLIVCCLKSGHEYKEDWRFPGACFGAVLPDDLSGFDEDHQLNLTLIQDGMLRNHGFSILRKNGYTSAVVGCEEGVYLFTPPEEPTASWKVDRLLSVPASDAILMDLDRDGLEELGCISPFHGSSLTIYHLDTYGNYVPQWKYDRPESETEMLHATWADSLLGKPSWIVGWRKGTKETISISWDETKGDYVTDLIDPDAGCANLLHFVNRKGEDVIIAANREIDEVAMYTVMPDEA